MLEKNDYKCESASENNQKLTLVDVLGRIIGGILFLVVALGIPCGIVAIIGGMIHVLGDSEETRWLGLAVAFALSGLFAMLIVSIAEKYEK